MKKYCFTVFLILSIVLMIGCNGPDTEGKTYTIRYYGNGNTGGFYPVDNNSYMSGDTAIVKDRNTLYKDGFEFLSWNTKPEGDGVTYKVGDTITVKNMNIRLYATWGILP